VGSASIALLGQSELLALCTTAWPLNTRHVRHVHRGELGTQLAHGPRRPLGRALSLPPAGVGDEPAACPYCVTSRLALLFSCADTALQMDNLALTTLVEVIASAAAPIYYALVSLILSLVLLSLGSVMLFRLLSRGMYLHSSARIPLPNSVVKLLSYLGNTEKSGHPGNSGDPGDPGGKNL
jgi:hypothetical protein